MIFWKKTMTTSFGSSFNFIFDIFYPSGEPISQYLLRCGAFAVEYYSFILHISQLQQSRLVNNPGLGDKMARDLPLRPFCAFMIQWVCGWEHFFNFNLNV